MNRIDARRLAAEGGELSGATAIAKWPRAAESVADPTAELRWHVTAGNDDHGRPMLQIGLRGAVDVVCQRCLQPLRIEIGGDGATTNVLLASSDRELAAWDEEVEDAEVVLAREPLDLDELLEDEFLLSLPFSPMCDDPACPRHQGIDAQQDTEDGAADVNGPQNPFAALRGKLGATKD